MCVCVCVCVCVPIHPSGFQLKPPHPSSPAIKQNTRQAETLVLSKRDGFFFFGRLQQLKGYSRAVAQRRDTRRRTDKHTQYITARQNHHTHRRFFTLHTTSLSHILAWGGGRVISEPGRRPADDMMQLFSHVEWYLP